MFRLFTVCLFLAVFVLQPQEQVGDITEQLNELLLQHKQLLKPYIIHGSNRQELRKEMNEKGPADSSGKRGDAYTSWHIEWSWPFDENRKPDFTKTKVDLTLALTIPEWSERNVADAKLQRAWDAFLLAVVKHELQHVSNVTSRFQLISNQIKQEASSGALTTKRAHAIADSVVESIHQADRILDNETRHGVTQGVRF